jgi:hypothetical protein
MSHLPAVDSKESAGAPEIEIEVTSEMINAAYVVWQKYGVRDVLEIDRCGRH